MINYTVRLDSAIRKAAWAHEQQKQHRTGSNVPYIVHPFGVMNIANNYTNNEDILIACLLHDVLEDVNDAIYDEYKMRNDFGDKVLGIVKDVTKDKELKNWHDQSNAYLTHLENNACDEAIIVSASDKMHNLLSTLVDYQVHGDELWQRFTTKNAHDQLWWYESILDVIMRRSDNAALNSKFVSQVAELKKIVK